MLRVSVFKTAEELRAAVIERYPDLSKRLQQVAKYIIDQPNDFAIETLATISDRSGVQPSTIVRFAKEFGFDGASAMQRLFRDKLIQEQSALGYRQRVRRLDTRSRDMTGALSIKMLLEEFVDTSISALQHLDAEANARVLDDVVHQIARSDTVYVAGFRRSFPVAAYFGYALSKAGKRVVVVDGVGGLHREQISSCSSQDLLIATSFAPYARETIELCQVAAANKTRIFAITDSDLSPLTQIAESAVAIQDADVRGFRSLPATLCLAQAIVVGYLYLSEKGG